MAATEPHIARFTVQSSDVLSDMRLNVSEEGSDRVKWYKERFLGDEEIIEHIVENATSTIHWTIHRPTRGWYIHIRSPAFPPGSFISLTPLPKSSPYHSEAALTFKCRTNASPPAAAAGSSRPKSSVDSDVTLTGELSTHSYPPTPPVNPAVRVHPPSPATVHAKLAEIPAARPMAQLTPFILTPHSGPHVPPTQPSMFSRVLAALKNSAPSHSSSFTLSPIPKVSQSGDAGVVPTPVPVVTYHDKTPVFTVRSMHGSLEIDMLRIQELGVHISFYIAVALTYLEYLTDRESFLAAETD